MRGAKRQRNKGCRRSLRLLHQKSHEQNRPALVGEYHHGSDLSSLSKGWWNVLTLRLDYEKCGRIVFVAS